MENYSFPSYPDSGNSSPRSREIDFDNPPPWEDDQPPTYKVKFMCSYGGKIHPRPHDNQLSYIGGETKILSVDRSVRFSAMIARLSALSGDADVAFKYQLPGEELDALISVTNDDDLDHLMHEYDRLYRTTARPARMRLFIFPANTYGSGASDRDHFIEAMNSGGPAPPKPVPAGNADFLFGQEKVVSAAPSPPPPQPQPEQNHGGPGRAGSGFVPDPAEIQRQLQELQRLQISEHAPPEAMYRRKSDDMAGAGFAGGDYYVHKMPEKSPATAAQPVSAPISYWHEKQQIVHGGQFSGPVTSPPAPAEQPMYVIHGHGGVYHQQQLIRQMSGQPGQGYYAVHQRGPSEVYNVGQPPQNQPQQPLPPHLMAAQQHQPIPPHHQHSPKVVEGMAAARQGGVMVSDGLTYAPVGYDTTTGRQVFYAAAGGGVGAPTQQYQGMGNVTAAMETNRRAAGPGG